ncbi:MAG TPA: hypothetical protein VMI76_04875 [Methyloceanibacter sp.]|nr:hypothetical protein [Methyloceanibacter sp.]
MDRRTVLGMLGVSGVLLSSLVRKAVGAAPEAAATSANPDQVLAQSAQHGLPTDWQFVAPTRWTTVDESLKTRLNSVLRDASPIDLGGIKVTRSGQIETGRLDPVGLAVELPPEVAALVSPADEALNLEVINSEYNPFLAEPRDASGKPLVGPFQAAGELYQGKTFLPVKLIMAGMVKAMSAPPSVLQPLIDALSELVVIRTPAHQHRIGAELGNRIVFYGEDIVNGQDINIGHTHIDKIVDALAAKNMRLAKQMVHFDHQAQGGKPDDIIADGVAGATHVGGFSEGYNDEGKPMSVKSDWPSNYGQLGVANRTYNAHLLAIDYSAGVEDPIPEQDLKAYYHNADMWDCCAAILVPFADRDPDPQYRDYMYNPLEVYDQQSARDVAAALATLDADKFLSQHGAFYCAEGQYVVANLGPQEDDKGGTLLKQSRFGDTPLGRLIANFIKAPGYAGMSAEERRQHPTIGWDYLLELGENNGGISAEQALILSATDRQGVALDFIDEDVKGWQAYRPKNNEALIARPMTVATLAWGLLRLYMPRDAVAKAIATDIARAYGEGDDSVKESVRTLLSEKDPMSANGQALLAGFSAKAATGLLLGLLSSDQVKASLLYKSGFMDITDDADKQRVLDAYEQFLGILQNADYSTQASLDKALEAADEALADLAVTRTYYNRTTRERQPAKSTVMKYAAPPCFGMWTQQPFLAETGCLRYVATAMHVSEMKTSAS